MTIPAFSTAFRGYGVGNAFNDCKLWGFRSKLFGRQAWDWKTTVILRRERQDDRTQDGVSTALFILGYQSELHLVCFVGEKWESW